jgi:hypothetical protein
VVFLKQNKEKNMEETKNIKMFQLIFFIAIF